MSLRAPTLMTITLLVTATVATTRNARADLAPPDLCTAPGQPCMNAAPTYNGAGTCTATTCTRNVPTDGGMMSMTYDCNLCKAQSDAGTGGAGGSTDAASDGKGSKGDSGCSISPDADGGTTGELAPLLFALAFVTAARRRRPPQRRP